MGTQGDTRSDASLPDSWLRVEEYWSWVAVVLFLLVTVDLLTTTLAAAALGPGAEANPLMRWALGQGPLALVGLNLLAVALAAGMFFALLEMVRATPAPYDRYFARLVEGWLGLLVAVGLAVLANNVAVVVLGRSLL